jgi:5'-nucleotidase
VRILVTNDDGIYSPGIHALATVAARFGQVRVVAPDAEQSATGHAITIIRPLRYRRIKLADFEAYQVNGTPADCVALGLHHWDGADLVLSGINLGYNLGHDIWHSGTVAAAKQAAFLNVPALAFSAAVETVDLTYETLIPSIEQVINLLLDSPRPFLVNVNLPPGPQGLRWTRQSVRSYNGYVVPGEDPMGRKHYWFSARPLTDPAEDTDRWAIENDLVSLTPLRLDLTDESWLANSTAADEAASATHLKLLAESRG